MHFLITEHFNRILIGEQADDLYENIVVEDNDMGHIFNMNEVLEEEDVEQSENESENEEEINARNDEDDPLYHDAPITVKESMLLLLSLMLRHNLNMTCIADIIKVIELHCPIVHFKANSLYKFKKFCNMGATNGIQKYFYFPKCLRDLEHDNNICPSCPQEKSSYFIQLPIIKQLKEMYRRRNFYNKLQQRFQRPDIHVNGNSIGDIYDGSLYKKWFHNGFLRSPNNISFTWYTDGIPVFKSSKVGVWPLYLTINEIPHEERKKKKIHCS